MRTKTLFLLKAVLLLTLAAVPACSPGAVSPRAENGNTVKVDYTGRLADGSVFDSSSGREPLEFTVGSGQVVPGFDKAVLGMKVGESKTVTIPAADAYGARVDNLVITADRADLGPDITPEIGQKLIMQRSDGGIVEVTVTGLTDTTITVDANHPLAGKDLTFEIKLVAIE